MNEPLVILVAGLSLLAAAIMLKSIYFVRAARKRTFKRWFYFTRFDIIDAPSERIKNLRTWQNTFSLVILIILLVLAAAFLIMC